MIVYFSATGNCKYVADYLSNHLQDKTLSITSIFKSKNFKLSLKDGESFILITPTYGWGLPPIVKTYLERLELNIKPVYSCFIATYGTTPGSTYQMARSLFEKKGYSFQASFSVQMPDTWTPTYDLSNKKKLEKIHQKSDKQIASILQKIARREKGHFTKRELPLPIGKFYYQNIYPSMRKTSHFHVEESCIGCGLCQRNCPYEAIQLVDRKPTWVKEECLACLSCLHHCPKFAIQYDNKTNKHGQYQHPRYSGSKKDS